MNKIYAVTCENDNYATALFALESKADEYVKLLEMTGKFAYITEIDNNAAKTSEIFPLETGKDIFVGDNIIVI